MVVFENSFKVIHKVNMSDTSHNSRLGKSLCPLCNSPVDWALDELIRLLVLNDCWQCLNLVTNNKNMVKNHD